MFRQRVRIAPLKGAAERDADRAAAGALQGRWAHGPVARDGSARSASGLVDDVGTGRPMDAGARSWFEPRFGHDFAKVRIFTGQDAGRSARALGAQAYTVGGDIVF